MHTQKQMKYVANATLLRCENVQSTFSVLGNAFQKLLKVIFFRKICLEEQVMAEFTISEMQEMQKKLQDKYKNIWEPISVGNGKNKLLWMIGEVGEVIDIVKKNGGEKAASDETLRKQLIEEMADVLMYYNDVMLCYGITEEELKQAYIGKFEHNMNRW